MRKFRPKRGRGRTGCGDLGYDLSVRTALSSFVAYVSPSSLPSSLQEPALRSWEEAGIKGVREIGDECVFLQTPQAICYPSQLTRSSLPFAGVERFLGRHHSTPKGRGGPVLRMGTLFLEWQARWGRTRRSQRSVHHKLTISGCSAGNPAQDIFLLKPGIIKFMNSTTDEANALSTLARHLYHLLSRFYRTTRLS